MSLTWILEALRAVPPVAGLAVGSFMLLLLVLTVLLRNRREPEPWEGYELRPALLTRAERRFYATLTKALRPGPDLAGGAVLAICPQVRLIDVVRPQPNADYGSKQRRKDFAQRRSRVWAKHLDFVICHGETLELLAAIELDDASHDRPERQERDAFLDDLLDDVGLPLVRVKVMRRYDAAGLRRDLAVAIGVRLDARLNLRELAFEAFEPGTVAPLR